MSASRAALYRLACRASSSPGPESPEFLGYATAWVYSLDEWDGNPAEAEKRIQEEGEAVPFSEHSVRARGLLIMMKS